MSTILEQRVDALANALKLAQDYNHWDEKLNAEKADWASALHRQIGERLGDSYKHWLKNLRSVREDWATTLHEHIGLNLDSVYWQGIVEDVVETRQKEHGDPIQLREEFWRDFYHEISPHVSLCQNLLQLVRHFEGKPAWKVYGYVLELSQDIFSECLDYLQALLVRDRGLEGHIFNMADDLIQHCRTAVPGCNSRTWTGATAQDSFDMTFGRIIRVRFPEWDLWTLPGVAHEFGHVVAKDKNLSRIADSIVRQASQIPSEEIKELLAQNSCIPNFVKAGISGIPKDIEDAIEEGMKALTDETRQELKGAYDAFKTLAPPIGSAGQASRAAKWFVEELFADMFATFLMGPAYAYTLFYLRLSPFHWVDLRRAWVVLLTLQKRTDGATTPMIQQEVQTLRGMWDNTLKKVYGPGFNITPEYVSNATQELLDGLGPEGWQGYSYATGNSNWLNALTWYNRLRVSESSAAGGSPKDSKGALRDLFNGAWLTRIHDPAVPPNEIAKKAHNAWRTLRTRPRFEDPRSPEAGRRVV